MLVYWLQGKEITLGTEFFNKIFRLVVNGFVSMIFDVPLENVLKKQPGFALISTTFASLVESASTARRINSNDSGE